MSYTGPTLSPSGGEPVVCDDGTVLPPDPLAGIEPPEFDDGPAWMSRALVDSAVAVAFLSRAGMPPIALPPLPVDQSADVTAAVFAWQVAAVQRRQAEAAEATTLLAAETAFRADFEAEFPGLDWCETGLKCFVADAATIMACGPRAAAQRLRAARRAHDALPSVWDLFARGEVTQAQVSLVAAESEGLDADFVAAFDAECAVVLQRQPGSRLSRIVIGVRERVQARTADERHRRAKDERGARLEPGRDGMARYVLEGPVERLAAIDQAAHKSAVAARGHEGEARSIAVLKFDVVEDLILDGFAVAAAGVRDALLQANPQAPQRGQAVPQRRQVLPTVILHVPVLTLLGRSDEPPTLDGVGPIAPGQAKALCATAPSFFRVLTHPVTGARLTLDRAAYSPPADLRRWIQVRDEYSRFPGSLTPAHLSDIDHVREWSDAGVTNDDNLVALSRDKHVLKSMGLYTVSGDPNGELVFMSPMGIRHVSTPRAPAAPVTARLRQWATAHPLPDDCPF